MPRPKPLLLIAGFLGAGKTTLIRGLLAELSRNGVRADVVLNDIANAEIDAASLDADQAASISPLAASCACCESLEELVTLCKTAERGEGDLLVIELNGTADPLGLLESFSLLKAELPFAPMWQLCVIDVRHWGERGELTPIERRQMDGAGFYFLSHTEAASDDDLRAVETMIEREFAGSVAVTADELAGALVTGAALPAVGPVRSSGHHDDEVHLLSHQVKGVQIPLPPKVRRGAIERLLHKLPAGVLRAKALVKLVEEPGARWLFERSGTEVSPTPTPVSGITQLSSSLLCMGLRLDPEPIRALVSEAFGVSLEPADQSPG